MDALNWTLTILAAVRSTLDDTAGAVPGIRIGALVLNRAATPVSNSPVQNKVPADPVVRHRTTTLALHEIFVALFTKAVAVLDARIVPFASAPVPQ